LQRERTLQLVCRDARSASFDRHLFDHAGYSGSLGAHSSTWVAVPRARSGQRLYRQVQFATCTGTSRCAGCAKPAASLLLALGARAVDTFPIYLFIFIVFLNRYVFGFYLTLVRGKKLDATIDGFEPTITIVVPLFNEGRSIYDTIISLVKLDYPQHKLEVTVVDDCSTDDSYDWACSEAVE
jgi:hypothetical protein